MFGIIYIITNSINNKVYIGQTIQTLNARWQAHCRRGCFEEEQNMQIKRAIRKYGKNNFCIKELEKFGVKQVALFFTLYGAKSVRKKIYKELIKINTIKILLILPKSLVHL